MDFEFKNDIEFFLDKDKNGKIELIPFVDVIKDNNEYISPHKMLNSVLLERKREIEIEKEKKQALEDLFR